MKHGNGTSNPNVTYNECLRLAAKAKDHSVKAIHHREFVRRSLYRLAVAFQELTKSHHEWLIGQAARVGGITAMMDGWFRPLALFGEDYRDLLRDVAEGVTEVQYMASTAGSFLRRKRIAKLSEASDQDASVEELPASSLPVEERIVILETQNYTLREQLRVAYNQARELRRIAARQEKRIEELEAGYARIERAVKKRAS